MSDGPIATLVELKKMGMEPKLWQTCSQPHPLSRGCAHYRLCNWRKVLRERGLRGPAYFAPYGDALPCYRLMSMGVNAEAPR